MADITANTMPAVMLLAKDKCIKEWQDNGIILEPAEMVSQVMNKVRDYIRVLNLDAEKGTKWTFPKELDTNIIADLIAEYYPVAKIPYFETDNVDDMDLAIYQFEGPDAGLYVSKRDVFHQLIREFNSGITRSKFEEILLALRYSTRVPIKQITRNENLVPVNNGIFLLDQKMLIPFNSEYVFVKKCRIDYVSGATNPVIHHPVDGDWDVESWVRSLSDDEEIINLIWQVIASIVRPYTDYQKTILLYSEVGSNGKGTLCTLLRGLATCSESISIKGFSEEYSCQNIMRANAIICDENSVGSFAKENARFKAAASGDSFQINRKYEMPITVRFDGRIVECVNEIPRFADISESLYRRLLVIPFTKKFKDREKKRYIKSDYLKRQDVLEYVLCRVLHMNFDEFDNPEACERLKDDIRVYNDNIRAFLDEILEQLVWNLVPYGFIYSLYVEWHKINVPSGTPEKKQKFINHVKQILVMSDDFNWEPTGDVPMKAAHRMEGAEPLIATYNVKGWMRQNYHGNDIRTICTPNILPTQTFRGIYRKSISGKT